MSCVVLIFCVLTVVHCMYKNGLSCFIFFSRILFVLVQDEPYGEEGAELLGGNDSGYGALSNLSQMPLMPQGYTRGN